MTTKTLLLLLSFVAFTPAAGAQGLPPAAPVAPVAPFAPVAPGAPLAPVAPPQLDLGPGVQRPFVFAPAPGKSGQDEGLYDQARGLIERNQYERALAVLDRVISDRGSRADAAMYWKAYSLSKLSRRDEALKTLADLQKDFAGSAWVKDARALEVEIRQSSGQQVTSDVADDELKLLALRGLMASDPDAAMPVIERMLAGDSSVRVKDRALFILGQSRSARGRELLANAAKSASNPDLRMQAIRYLGMRSDAEGQQVLEDIYRSSSDAAVKRSVLSALAMSNSAAPLAQIARTEKDPDLQRTAIRSLGMSGRSEAAEALRTIYASDTPVDTRKAVIEALSMQPQSAADLVALARAEKNPELKTEIVRRLSMMRAPAARDYMLELLK